MLNRFFLDTPFEKGAELTLGGDEFHHAVRVHRTKVGEEVELFDGKGRGAVASVRAIDRSVMLLEVLREIVEPRDPKIELEIALALIQPEKFELVLQKATELGAASFVPLITERTEVRAERVAGKRERWEKILLEAAKQSGRLAIPRLSSAEPLETALARPGVNVILDPAGAPAHGRAESVRVFVGPEGGWSDEEISRAAAMGAASLSLGPLRLRAETAAIAAAALVLRA
ncbi:MAG TPA: RsmE family RNA methyltransferase [Thermoanaerobaculia bacterium]